MLFSAWMLFFAWMLFLAWVLFLARMLFYAWVPGEKCDCEHEMTVSMKVALDESMNKASTSVVIV